MALPETLQLHAKPIAYVQNTQSHVFNGGIGRNLSSDPTYGSCENANNMPQDFLENTKQQGVDQRLTATLHRRESPLDTPVMYRYSHLNGLPQSPQTEPNVQSEMDV